MIEYSNIMGKRFVATANGPEEFRDLRALGCPANIAARVEQRFLAPRIDDWQGKGRAS